MGDGSVGSIFLDLVVKDTVGKQVQAIAEKAQATAQKSFAGMEQTIGAAAEKAVAKATRAAASAVSSASRAATQAADAAQKAVQATASSAASCGQQVESTIGQSFSKSVAIAQSKVAQLEKAFDAVTYKLDGQWYSGAFDPASKATQQLLAQQEKLMARLEAAQDRLAIEAQAAAQKKAAAEEAAAKKAAAADAAAKAKQEAAAQKAAAAARKSAQQAAAAQEREAKKNEAAQQKAAQAAAKAHEQSAFRIKNAFSKAFSGAKKMAGGFGNAVSGIKNKFSAAGKSASQFGTRLKSIISGALVFNLLSSALRKMTDYLGTAVCASSEMKDALANLKGAAMTAAQPIVETLTPALTALANGAATVLSYLTRLISFFTGKTVASMSSAAKKIQGTAGAAKKAMASLAGFDEIQKLDSNDSGGTAEVQPNFDFQGQSSFLDSVMESVKAGNWGGVGALLSKKLNSCLNSINWPNIQRKASSWVSGLVEGINGFVRNLDWGNVGSTIGESFNTLITSVGTFFANMDWASLGSSIGEGISSIFTSIDWEQCKKSLTEGFNGILELVPGFASGFAPLQGIDFSAATKSLQGLWQSVWDFAELVGGDLAEVYNTVLKPLLKWTIEDAAPATVDALSAAFRTLNAAVKPVGAGIRSMFKPLKPVFEWIKKYVLLALERWRDLFDKLAKVFEEKGPEIQNIFSGIGEIIGVVWAKIEPILTTMQALWGHVFSFIGDLVANTIGYIIDLFSGWIDFFAGVFTGDFDRAFQGICSIFKGAKEFFGKTWESIKKLFSGLCAWFDENVSQPISGFFTDAWESIKKGAEDAWKGVKEAFSSVGRFFSDTFTEAWEKVKEVFSPLGKVFVDIKKGVLDGFKEVVNKLISGINNVVAVPFNGINDALNAIKGINILGAKPFAGIKTISVPQIPMLANGGVITQPTLAMMGEYAGARNNPEIVSPQSLIEQTVANAMREYHGDMVRCFDTVVSVLQEILAAVLDIESGDDVFANAVARHEAKMAIMRGGV